MYLQRLIRDKYEQPDNFNIKICKCFRYISEHNMYLLVSAVVLAVLALEGQAQHVPCCFPERWTGAIHQSLRFARRDSPTFGYRSVSTLYMRNFSCLGMEVTNILLICLSYYFRPTWNTPMITRTDDLQLVFTMNIQARTRDSC